MPSQVGRIFRGLLHIPDCHGIHYLRWHITSGQRCTRRMHSQLGGRQSLELTPECPECRPLRRHDEQTRHVSRFDDTQQK